MPAWTSELLTSLEQLERLRPEWDRLAASHPIPMAQADWVLTAAATIDSNADFRTFIVRGADGSLGGVAPLMLNGAGPVAKLVQIGFRTYEPPCLVFEEESALRALLEAVGGLGLPLLLRGAYADTEQAGVFADVPRGGLRPAVGGNWSTAYKRLDIPDLDVTIAGKRRSLVKRKRKAAEKMGDLEVAFFSPAVDELDAALDELVAVENAGWKGRAGTSLHHDTGLQEFFRRYAKLCAEHRRVRFGRVSIAGKVAAMRMDVEWAGQRWELKIGFDEAYSDVSPGQLLSYETFRDAMARGLTVHNFLGGYEPSWQDDWGVEVRPVTNLRRYPSSLRGLVALGTDTIDYAVRKYAAWAEKKKAAPSPPT